MEAVQQTVIHLDRAAMPSQAQMAYSQRNPQIHGQVFIILVYCVS